MLQTILTYSIIILAVGVILRKVFTLVAKKPVTCKPDDDSENNKCSACTENCPFVNPKT
jgi:hypothetical protein